MSKVKVSVCIPVYNCELYIKESIDSVLNQTFQDFELIILDNKSTDKTIEVVKEYKDPRIKLFQNDSNIGMLGNWNKVMTYASGEYIKILPADDIIYPDCLQLQVTALDNDTQHKISLVCGRKNVANEHGKVLFTRGFSRKREQVDGIKAINKGIRSGGNIIGEPGVVMFRKDVLQKTGGFEASIYYTMDLDLWYRMLLHGDLFVLPEVISMFRISSNSESVKIVKQQKNDLKNFTKKIYSLKKFNLSWFSYVTGLFSIELSLLAKKMIYRHMIK